MAVVVAALLMASSSLGLAIPHPAGPTMPVHSSAAVSGKAPGHKNLSVADAEKLMAERKDVVVLDVRTDREFRGGRINNAKHINFYDSDFDRQVSRLDREKTYVVYCAVGGRSASAAAKMSKLGFKSVYNLEGGIKGWEKAGRKAER
jgi:phage shock protein E